MNKLIVLFLCLVGVFAQSTQKQCRALVLEAGGDLGSFEAGAIKALVEQLAPEEVEYDVVTGISVGSINALGVSLFAKGEEKEMADWIVALWSSLKRTDIYTNFPGGIIQGLLYERGLFDSTNCSILLSSLVKGPAKRKLNIGTCNLRNGELKRYHEDLAPHNLVQAVLASSAVPTFFPYSTFENEIYVDGATTGQLLDIEGAIERCREVVDDDSQITVDVIFVQFAQLGLWSTNEKKKTLEVIRRSNDIQAYTLQYRELIEAMDLNKSVNFRYIIKPSQPLYSPKLPFLFNNEQMNAMINQGYVDTTNIIQAALNPQGNSQEAYKEANELYAQDLNISVSEKRNDQMDQRLKMYQKIKQSM